MKKMILLFPLLVLSACTQHAEFIPENEILNDATTGKPYYGQINIFGGRVLSYNERGGQVLVGDIFPENTGLYLQYCDEDEMSDCLKIRGIPTKEGVVKIRVYGGLAGGMFLKSGEFDKTYTITIKKGDVLP